jgi:hypothetical protein
MSRRILAVMVEDELERAQEMRTDAGIGTGQ